MKKTILAVRAITIIKLISITVNPLCVVFIAIIIAKKS